MNDGLEREKKNMATLIPQFKKKRSFKREELTLSGVGKFSRVNVLAKHTNTMYERNDNTLYVRGECTEQKHLCLWRLD